MLGNCDDIVISKAKGGATERNDDSIIVILVVLRGCYIAVIMGIYFLLFLSHHRTVIPPESTAANPSPLARNSIPFAISTCTENGESGKLAENLMYNDME